MDKRAFTDLLFETARRAGVENCEAYCAWSERFSAEVLKGELDEYKVSASLGLSFRVEVNGRMGYAYTERLDEESAQYVVEKAIENAAAIETDDPEFMFAGGEYVSFSRYNPALDEVPAADKIALAKIMEQEAFAASDLVKRVLPSAVSSGTGGVFIRNTKGLDVSFQSNSITAFLFASVTDEGESIQNAYDVQAVTDFGEIDGQAIARKAVEKALSKRGGKPVATGVYRTAFNPEASRDLLQVFSGAFSAEMVQKGMSRLKDQEGEQIAAEIVHIIDDPHMERGFASCPFDDEGVPTRYKAVVDGGRLTTLLHNLKTAAKASVESTGNASKAGVSAPVQVSPSNFYIKAGDMKLEALLKTLGDGLYITELEGLHAGADAVSGDFSLLARGFVVEGGKLGRAVENITVAANYFDMLKTVTHVADDLEFGMPGGAYYGSPSILVKEINVAGE